MRPLTHAAHRKFVETEGWEKKGTARKGRGTGDHERYTLRLATGDVLYTRVSHGAGQLDDPAAIEAVYRNQLQVSEADFWDCVENGTLPARPKPSEPDRPKESLDATLVRNLIRKVGLSVDEVGALTKDEAVKRWQDYLTGGGA
jgi:hypothetical protein